MPISTKNNKISVKGGKIVNRLIKTLAFETKGDRFPTTSYSGNYNNNNPFGNERVYFDFIAPCEIIIEFGDGISQIYTASQINTNLYRIGFTVSGNPINELDENTIRPTHFYDDENIGTRIISFTFSNPETFLGYFSNRIIFQGNPPDTLDKFPNFEDFTMAGANELTSLPVALPNSLKKFDVGNSLIARLNQIPDSIFNTQMERLVLAGLFDLSNSEISNLFKINQLKTTLTTLRLDDCKLKSLPEEMGQLEVIDFLNLISSEFDIFPDQFKSCESLTRLYIGNRSNYNSGALADATYPDSTNLINLRYLDIQFSNLSMGEDLKEFLRPLVSIYQIIPGFFTVSVGTVERLDQFINTIYEVVTEEAYLDPSSAPVSELYPNKHRGVVWGHSSLQPTGTVEAPPEFQLGASNGNPQHPGHQVYVLMSNYSHNTPY
ncbi:hypothetical protein [Mesonia sp.]|uniref:hypothetical protein n=1 Tax=Mesonia sp. TaxID=1960830 RepID=UPI00175C76AF|nr:hypothetical protein [Mesonia sp.]HIB37990.1 leucine-rich repeat domain-containing protein [Mesonia sp.]